MSVAPSPWPKRLLAPDETGPSQLETAVTAMLRRAQFARWYGAVNRLRGRQRAVIVMYHSFTPGGWGAIPPSTLRWHLELLRELCDVVPLTRLAVALANREPTDRMVSLTVDDGYEDFFTVAYPILSELRLPATLFVPTGFIGGQSEWYRRPRALLRIASASLLRELDPGLVSVGSHSVHHRPLARLPVAALEHEARRSKSDLESLLGVPVTLFAYPFGGRGAYDDAATAALRAAGFQAAVTTRWDTYSAARELLRLPRVWFAATDDPDDVQAKLAGDFDWLNERELVAHLLRSTFTHVRNSAPVRAIKRTRSSLARR